MRQKAKPAPTTEGPRELQLQGSLPGLGDLPFVHVDIKLATDDSGQGETVRFSVTDGANTVPVEYTGVLPDLFGENQGMVGTGSYVDGVFQASEILAKHDEEYMPKEVLDALKEQGTYVDPNS